jgi:hypothetical protein
VPQQQVVGAFLVLPKMSKDKVGVAKDFWLALARNGRAGAQEVVNHLDLPLVATSPFSFQEIKGEFEDTRERKPLEPGGAQGVLSPRPLNIDTPKATLNAWNAEDRMALVVVSRNKICGTRFADGEVDFFDYVGALNCPGGSGCKWTTHATGGKDAKGCLVLKMKLPEGRGKAFAILVKSLGSAVKRPKIFFLLTLSQAGLPYGVLPEEWDETLLTLKLSPREWKFFFKIYQGASWLVGLLNGGGFTAAAGERPSVNVPLPRMGKGGYDPENFKDKPPNNLPCSSLFQDRVSLNDTEPEPALWVPLFSSRGNRESSQLVLLVGSQEGSHADAGMCSDIKCIPNLEKRARLLDGSLPLSFGRVRDKLEDLWKEVESIKDWMSASPQDCSGSSPLFQGRRSSSTMPQSATLSPPALQILMRQVVNKLWYRVFVTRDKMEAHVSVRADFNATDQLSGLGKWVTTVEKKFTDLDSTLAKIESRITSLEDWRAGDSIKRSDKAFQDISAIAVWVQTFEDKELFHYCVDMVTRVMLCADPYKTIAEGMATAAATHKAEYNSLTKAHISLSYGLTYLEILMKKYNKEEHAATGGWFWTTTWSSYAVFKGTFNNGAKDTFSSSLVEVSRMIQNAIGFAFPLATYPLT